ncbi:SDR family oxidoreductase [Chitinophaga filiformis]|uniref:SDR family oxidoreductase n=1 Tax=Chitinophaga filiformis TaxID=104663 RepID=A0ABY4I3T6_CHIFI|nr:SDR family oxidoreductase [Chitinophaga filiformis]UPK70275.1 SDR family oxidoreductase [Chitinophaga filiformis]
MKKVILITGASSGLGKATSMYFANQGWNVVATMRNPEKEQDLINVPNIHVSRLDVQDTNSIRTAIETGIRHFGRIDALVNNAGYGQQGIFEAVTPEKIREQFEVNVFGLMEVTRAVLPHFRKQKGGTIVNVTSGAGRVTVPLLSIYSASKYAVEGYSESLSYELASQNIKVKIVEPGYIVTDFYKRAAHEFANDPSLTDYNDFLADMNALFSSFNDGQNATADDVAGTIYKAVTDGTPTLRYVIGPDLEPMIALRDSHPDHEYMTIMRSRFMPKAFAEK